MTSPWSMWRPIPTSLLGGTPYPPTERSLYTLYGGLFGLNNSNFVFPALGLHPFMTANNINNMRLRDGVPPPTSVYSAESGAAAAAAAQLHYPTALYRYHPYLNSEKLAAQKSSTSSPDSSPTMDAVRP